jgi:protein-L-isoaspartate(D-aspartate) O-methyltransferase
MESSAARHRMVTLQLENRGIADPRVLNAFRSVPREAFVAERLLEFAYEDTPLPIGEGQTISQPYIVALMVEALALLGNERVLDIGTGSGYAAAILSRLAREVYGVERLESLTRSARAALAKLGYENVQVCCGDGTLGWSEHAPYDAIAVAAGGPAIPNALLSQLAVGGRLVMPVGPDDNQLLVRVVRVGTAELRQEVLTNVSFVPLVGQQGWPEKTAPACDDHSHPA